MKICSQNQNQVIFELSVSSPDGTPKTNITLSTLRIYQVVDTVEVDILATSALSQIEISNIYRYIWEPATLEIGEYFIEYYFSDLNSKEIRRIEELVVLNVPTAEDFEIVKQIEIGKWKIINNQMIFYEEDGETELLKFNLYDANGDPTSTSPLQRVPV